MSLFVILMTVYSQEGKSEIVNDVTGLNPITVDEILIPTKVEDIINAVKTHSGPISIGGGRFSMGGQTATEHTLQLDMRHFNKIIDFSPNAKEITVQTGITWREIIEYIDPYDLSVSIMQSYADFSVGGSLSVNVHGRYVGQGAIVHSVKSIKMVLADGQHITASPTENSDLFYAAIGGYGGIGVITEATLMLAENTKLERQDLYLPASAYKDYFMSNIKNNPNVIFHNADLYLETNKAAQTAYSLNRNTNKAQSLDVRAVSFVITDKEVTIKDRIQSKKEMPNLMQVIGLKLVANDKIGESVRQKIIDPARYAFKPVLWRNYEASHNTSSLEPPSRQDNTFVLQEYFIPVEQFDLFYPIMADIIKNNDANVINVSIRHAKPDTHTLLSWSNAEVFSFVIYYRQRTDAKSQQKVKAWTRELIDAALKHRGTYYLPYQIHATPEQFLKAYPKAPEYLAIKKKVDPTNKFRNKLLDTYFSY